MHALASRPRPDGQGHEIDGPPRQPCPADPVHELAD